MYAVVVRIYSAVLWLGLLLGFLAGYYFVKNNPMPIGPEGQQMSPLVGGLIFLFFSIVILGAGLTLAGIYENTLATANALRRMSGQRPLGDGGTTAPGESDQALQEALPLHAGHFAFIAFVLAFLAFIVYFLVQRAPG